MKKIDALKYLNASITDDIKLIYANGRIAREGYYVKDRRNNFYMLSSMGHASSIGLGVAEATDKSVIVIDGDGNILMNFNSIPAIGSRNVKHFIHIVFDNNIYETTGGQKTIMDSVQLDKVCKHCGYNKTYKVYSLQDFTKALDNSLNEHGAVLIWAIVEVNQTDPTKIIPLAPEKNKIRFMQSNCVENEWSN